MYLVESVHLSMCALTAEGQISGAQRSILGVELEGVPGYAYTRGSCVRLAGRSPLCRTPKGFSKALNQAKLALD